jgi:hypothetical protein
VLERDGGRWPAGGFPDESGELEGEAGKLGPDVEDGLHVEVEPQPRAAKARAKAQIQQIQQFEDEQLEDKQLEVQHGGHGGGSKNDEWWQNIHSEPEPKSQAPPTQPTQLTQSRTTAFFGAWTWSQLMMLPKEYPNGASVSADRGRDRERETEQERESKRERYRERRERSADVRERQGEWLRQRQCERRETDSQSESESAAPPRMHRFAARESSPPMWTRQERKEQYRERTCSRGHRRSHAVDYRHTDKPYWFAPLHPLVPRNSQATRSDYTNIVPPRARQSTSEVVANEEWRPAGKSDRGGLSSSSSSSAQEAHAHTQGNAHSHMDSQSHPYANPHNPHDTSPLAISASYPAWPGSLGTSRNEQVPPQYKRQLKTDTQWPQRQERVLPPLPSYREPVYRYRRTYTPAPTRAPEWPRYRITSNGAGNDNAEGSSSVSVSVNGHGHGHGDNNAPDRRRSVHFEDTRAIERLRRLRPGAWREFTVSPVQMPVQAARPSGWPSGSDEGFGEGSGEGVRVQARGMEG